MAQSVESLLTVSAVIRLLSSVYPLMCFYIAQSGETLATMRAKVRHLSYVCSLVTF
jgi:hypothetical protein